MFPFIIYNLVLSLISPLLIILISLSALFSDKFKGTVLQRMGIYNFPTSTPHSTLRTPHSTIESQSPEPRAQSPEFQTPHSALRNCQSPNHQLPNCQITKSLNHQSPATYWIHAVSVGEAQGGISLVKFILSQESSSKIFFSTTTKGGMELVSNVFKGKGINTFFFPLDVFFFIRAAVSRVKPDCIILLETEIWPNLIFYCYKKHIPVFLVNGRVSDRMLASGWFVKSLYKYLLPKFSSMLMQTGKDTERILKLGAKENITLTAGNIKFDVSTFYGDANKIEEIKKILKTSSYKIFTAGSTHPGEDEILIEVYKILLQDFSEMILILCPRHIERANELVKLCDKNKLDVLLKTSIATQWTLTSVVSTISPPCVIILNTIGELNYVYAISDITFVGGSLIKRGGHNVLEPAAQGKTVFFGASTENFRQSVELLEKNGVGIIVKDAADMAEKVRRYLSDDERRKRLDEKAREIIFENSGVCERIYAYIKQFNVLRKIS